MLFLTLLILVLIGGAISTVGAVSHVNQGQISKPMIKQRGTPTCMNYFPHANAHAQTTTIAASNTTKQGITIVNCCTTRQGTYLCDGNSHLAQKINFLLACDQYNGGGGFYYPYP